MLVHVTDIKGKHFWVNPVHVKLLQEGKKGLTEIVLTWGGGWSTNLSIKTERPLDDIAAELNAAMPGLIEYVPEDDGQVGGGQAAAAAGVIT